MFADVGGIPVTACHPIAAEPTAGDDLVVSHLPLVAQIVRDVMRRLPTHVNRDDLMSAGTFALMLAARGFDPGRGAAFAGFAAIRVRGAIMDELRAMDWATRSVRTRAREAESVSSMLSARLHRSPTREEVAQAMGVSVSALDAVHSDVQRASVLSLHSFTADELGELAPSSDDTPDAVILRREQLGILCNAIAELPERMRIVIERYFFEQRNVAAIASELGLSVSRVWQLRTEALQLLRAGMQACGVGPAQTPTTSPSPNPAAMRRSYRRAVANLSAKDLCMNNAAGETLRRFLTALTPYLVGPQSSGSAPSALSNRGDRQPVKGNRPGPRVRRRSPVLACVPERIAEPSHQPANFPNESA
ncbi:MAG TPA: sigma-70 family RNA polymerase sigma factor [Jatrophihabitans sp.]|nr:sigma-70 family RNA polymerase sigma factor [Jatrophihabitans sp.]